MKDFREIAGIMSEEELDQLLGANVTGGTSPLTPSSIPCIEASVKVASVIGGAIVATMSIDACPTSGCTKSCNK